MEFEIQPMRMVPKTEAATISSAIRNENGNGT
jgi:hypothetical protein